MSEEIERNGVQYLFSYSDTHRLIRQRYTDERHFYPEVHENGRWVVGSPYVLDAITGMGEDPHSCGEWSEPWTLAQAEHFATQHGIDLFGEPELEQADDKASTRRDAVLEKVKSLFYKDRTQE